MLNVWLIPKWYPNRVDPQLGVFIQKHARAIALKNKVSVLYVQSVDGLNDMYQTVQKKTDNVDEITIYFKRDRRILRTFVNLFRYLRAINSGLSILKQISPSPDVFHAYIMLRPALIAWYLSIRMKVPFVISEQWSGYVTGKFEKQSFLKKLVTRWIIKRASALTCVSKFLLNGMEKSRLKNDHAFITPNCIEIQERKIPKDKNSTAYVLLVADLVDEIKNISGVIRMIASLEIKKPFELHIIGHGRDEMMLKKLVKELNVSDKVFFEGLKTNEQVYDFLHRSDFLVMNSRFETFSLICAEAMSCGKPVLATRCGGPDEFVTEETGILVQPDNPSELKAGFIKMFNNFEAYDSQKIMDQTRKLFSQEVASVGFESVYESIVIERK